MQIDTEHLHYWMQAIRQSPDPLRTMDAFWSGQLKSKEWLIDCLDEHVHFASSIDIFGGWVGTLASMLFQSNIPITTIRSIDIDPTCEPIATLMNKGEEIEGRFKAYTADMCDVISVADIIINTSCEHLTQAQYDKWLDRMPNGSLIIIQSNDYNIPEHVRWHKSFDEFKETCGLHFLWGGEMKLPLYTRYMIIGRKP
jgi:hypothetical protein